MGRKKRRAPLPQSFGSPWASGTYTQQVSQSLAALRSGEERISDAPRSLLLIASYELIWLLASVVVTVGLVIAVNHGHIGQQQETRQLAFGFVPVSYLLATFIWTLAARSRAVVARRNDNSRRLKQVTGVWNLVRSIPWLAAPSALLIDLLIMRVLF